MATRRPQVPRAARATGASARPAAPAEAKPSVSAGSATRTEPTVGGASHRQPVPSGKPKTQALRPARTSTASARAAAREFADAAPVPARAFSGRIVALVLVLVAVTVMLAPTVRVYFSQRAEIQGIQADIAARQSDQANLKSQISRWQDPAYVQQQARDRINMVMPGETSYWVFGEDGSSSTNGSTAGTSPGTTPSNVPWTQSLWDSVRRAATE